MNNCLDSGEYEKVIKECKEKLLEYPDYIDANWFIAKEYFYTENNEFSKKYFERVIYLVPEWEESANAYIGKINAR